MNDKSKRYTGAAEVLAGLKDFQRDTTEYVFGRLFTDRNPTSRFLVADEVGLGKTLVARGVIAKAIEFLQDRVSRVDIVYICSNAEIARQNIQKLNVTDDREFQLASRITLLPLTLRNLTSRSLNFASFTPGTSFNLRSNMGLSDERIVLYWLLRHAWGENMMRGKGPLKILCGAASLDRFGQRVKSFDRTSLDPGLTAKFKAALVAHDRDLRNRGETALKQRFRDLSDHFRYRRQIARTDNRERSKLIGELRLLLARTCVNALEPDLIILDEFQRFRELLDGDDPASELAQHLFAYEDARLLLLSATPYKMVTLSEEDANEDHHQDFTRTLRFLMGADAAAEVDESLRKFRSELLRPEGLDIDEARKHRTAAESRIRQVMCRTERLAVTADRNGMLIDKDLGTLPLHAADIRGFVALDRIARQVETGDVVEYWKSAPYLLNFMDGYELVRKLTGARRGDAVMAKLLAEVGDTIDWSDVAEYRTIDPANAKLRALMADVMDTEMWRWLWMPPALPYYSPGPPFDAPGAHAASKRLLFSSWTVVPKMIAALLSYEAERRMMSSGSLLPRNTPEDRRRAGQLLRFTRSKGRFTGMKVFGLLYPSAALATIGDPLRRTAGTAAQLDREDFLTDVRAEVAAFLEPWTARAPTTGNEDEDWYWLAPLLADLATSGVRNPIELFEEHLWASDWTGGESEDTGGTRTDESKSTFEDHLSEACERIDRIATSDDLGLGRVPRDLIAVTSLLAVGSPAVCALRALTRPAGSAATRDPGAISAAARVAWAFRSLFNLPEVTALVRGTHPDDAYWRAVLDYTVAGNLQAVLDEYAHILPDRLGILDSREPSAIDQMADALRDSMTVRTVSYSCHELVEDGEGRRLQQGQHRMRGRFALRFGQDRVEETGDTTRTTQVRDAFNSPFWPFVLATTSVGQEGLEFHSYCHACVHWNLPTNPVDLEQREGRVHRYKGHAVRKNVASKHGPAAFVDRSGDPWQALFDAAVAGRGTTGNDLVPYWIFPGDTYIERIVPSLPLSREVGRLAALRRSVAAYRLVIGQPRQDDLLQWLSSRYSEEEFGHLQEELRINLTPPAGRNGRSKLRSQHSTPIPRARL
jgi:hypothetical protein